jgi:flagellum-specific peptidoglycan hydrolase FlgJ
MWEAIKEVNLKGSHPSVVIAQGAVESNWGRSDLAKKYNNYFGIKAGSKWTGSVVNLQTGEVYNGQSVNVMSWFRVYDSMEESLRDRIELLTNNYQSALSASTPEQELQALQAGGYATSTTYVSTVMSVIESNNLTIYDKQIQYVMKASTTYSIFLALGIAVVALSAYKLFKK